MLVLAPTPLGQGTVTAAGGQVAAHAGLVMVTVPSLPVAVAATDPVPATTSVGRGPVPAVPGVATVTVPSLPATVTGAVIAVPGTMRVGGG